MRLHLTADVSSYKSEAQKARVRTEEWVRGNSYCPNCGSQRLEKFPNNTPAADFFCPSCGDTFELKSMSGRFGASIVDGEYDAMMRALRSAKNPNFFLLNYGSASLSVTDYAVVPKHFFVPNIIVKRAPLSKTAERKEWVGCNIDLRRVPEVGRVQIIMNGMVLPKSSVLRQWKRANFLRHETAAQKGWTVDVMRCIDSLPKGGFSIDDAYGFEFVLQKLHPENHHIKEKIRQQLQVLRDAGYLVFEARGKYRVRNH